MKIQLKSLALFLAGAALVLTGCQNENQLLGEDAGNSPEASGRLFYVNAGISLPSSDGTRSATDEGFPGNTDDDNQTNSDAETPDYEYGYDYENDVRTMILVFATKEENKFLAYSKVSGIDKAPTGSTTQHYTFDVITEIKYEDLKAAYEAGLLATSQEVNVYAFCNYTANLENLLKNEAKVGDASWIDWHGTVKEAGSQAGVTPAISNTIWANRSFLMTNYKQVSTKFPKTVEGWDEYADKENPFKVTTDGIEDQDGDLAPIQVERSAARFDFRDGSDGDNTYKMITDVHEIGIPEKGDAELNLFSVQLTRMALVNMSKNFYYLRRVSADGKNTGALVGGRELPATSSASDGAAYVVDCDWEDKLISGDDGLGNITLEKVGEGDDSEYFNFPLYQADGSYNTDNWYVDNIKDVLENNNKDTWTNRNYKIWRYVTENTIPGGPENQITIQSTGIVFKGRIIAGDDINEQYSTKDEIATENKERYVSDKVASALSKNEKGPILYSFDGFLYAGWEELIEGAKKDDKGGRLFTAVENILKKLELPDFDNLETALNNGGIKLDDTQAGQLRKMAKSEGITVYEPEQEGDQWGYYCYYFYWNRHNDNGKAGLMGVMEFATVRNNVYKLAVTKIEKFGHPRNKDDDPDPVEPEDPDEEPTRYIQVDVDVLPWVVRVNDITF